MNFKVIGLTIVVTLAILASVFAIAYFTIPQVQFGMNMMFGGAHEPGAGQGYGRGMMGGGGMGGGYYNNQPAANASSASSSVANATSSSASSSASSSVASSAASSIASSASSSAKSSAATSSANRLLVAVGTDGKTIPQPADSNLPDNTAVQTVGNTNVTIAISPFPPASFQKGTFDVTLKDDKGQAITDAQVTLDLTMPSMRMPTNKPTAQNMGNGKYTATATWTMRGWWRIEVIIVRGGVKQSAFFDTWL